MLLACAPAEQHTLPLHVLAAALAELRVPVRLLGGRVPGSALAAAVRRVGAGSVFVWRQLIEADGVPAEPRQPAELAALAPSRPAPRLVVGGPGWWQTALPAGAEHAPDLSTAVRLLSPPC